MELPNLVISSGANKMICPVCQRRRLVVQGDETGWRQDGERIMANLVLVIDMVRGFLEPGQSGPQPKDPLGPTGIPLWHLAG